LVKAVESPSLLETQHIVLDLKLRRKQEELLEAQKIAQRRSGARGKEARTAELQAEANLAEVEKAQVLPRELRAVTDCGYLCRISELSSDNADPAAMKEATDLLAEAELELNLVRRTNFEQRHARE
jgi:hypothetical protein